MAEIERGKKGFKKTFVNPGGHLLIIFPVYVLSGISNSKWAKAYKLLFFFFQLPLSIGSCI